MNDNDYLLTAYMVAAKSKEAVRCGCVIVWNSKIIAEEFNSQKTDQIAVHHAEVKAVYEANRKTGQRTLEGAVAYCTCEPCVMCLVALSYAKISRIVFHKSMLDLFPDDPQSRFNPRDILQTLNHIPSLEQVLL